MNSFERMRYAIEGRPVDQVPVSVWYHFGSEHLPPAAVAKLHADYQAAYAWDFLKVMFDYRLDVPDRVDGPAGLDLQYMLQTVDWAEPFRKQVEVIQALHSTLGSSVPIVDTIYSPWMYLVRHLGQDMRARMLEQPDVLSQVLERLTEETCRHVRRVRDLGCYGIYFATVAAENEALPDLRALQVSFDREVLQAAPGIVRMLHLHGRGLEFQAVEDYPAEVLHWEDSDRGNPPLSHVRDRGVCLMGGLPSTTLTGLSMQALRRMARDAIAAADTSGFILAPGCTVSPSLSSRKLHALRDSLLLAPSAVAV